MAVFQDESTRFVDLILLALFTISLSLSIVSTNTNSWLTLNPTNEYIPATTFGLFQSCTIFGDSTSCSPFPSKSLCDERGDFCRLWMGARVSMIVADCMGLMAMLGVVLALAAGEMKVVAGRMAVTGVLVHLLAQVATMSLIINVESNADGQQSPLPIFKTTFGYSFILCIVSWVLDVILSFVKLVSIGIMNRRAGYTDIDSN